MKETKGTLGLQDGVKEGTPWNIVPELAYLSLGSNVGDRAAQLKEALRRLGAVGRVTRASAVYETEPVEFTEQPWFLNCVAELETRLRPRELMEWLLRIEEEMGRRRIQKKGPRIIDIDILLFGGLAMRSAKLTVPHPAMQERRFVLEPLAEIAPDARHPVLGKTVLQLRDGLPAGQIVKRIEGGPAQDAEF